VGNTATRVGSSRGACRFHGIQAESDAMAFRLNRPRSITTELEKLVHSEFQTAIKKLDQPKPGADAIHEARKDIAVLAPRWTRSP
jgi:hypothetical protein